MVNKCELPLEMWSHIIKNLPEEDQLATYCTSHLLKKATLMAKIEIYRERLKDPLLMMLYEDTYLIKINEFKRKLGQKITLHDILEIETATENKEKTLQKIIEANFLTANIIQSKKI